MADTFQPFAGRTLLLNSFNGMRAPDDSPDILSDGHWDIRNGALFTNGWNDGALVFRSVDVSGDLGISFDIKTLWLRPWEDDDVLRVEVKIDGGWKLLDAFVINEDKSAIVGSHTGQRIGTERKTLSWSGGLLEGLDGPVQLRMVSEISAWNERLIIDNLNVVEISSDDGPPPVGPSILLHEAFDDIHHAADSKEIYHAGDWDIRRDMLETDGFDDGIITFREVLADGPVTLELDIFTPRLRPWETTDVFRIEARSGYGPWELVDEFRIDESSGVFRGSETGQTFGKAQIGLSFDNGPLGNADGVVQFRFVSDISAPNEKLRIDNVTLLGEPADPRPVNHEEVVIDFSGLPKGQVFSGDEYADLGIRFSASFTRKPLAIQDTSDPHLPFWSQDHFNPTQGAALIVSRFFHPNGSQREKPGKQQFNLDFDSAVFLKSLTTMDNDEPGSVIRLYGEQGLIRVVEVPKVPDGRKNPEASLQTVLIETDGVVRAEFFSKGSTFIDDITYKRPVPDAQTGEISGKLFLDANKSGLDEAEAGLGGAVVTLLDSAGAPLATATTTPEGNYAFTGLAAGSYSILFPVDPDGSGKSFTTQDAGDDAIDSDADPATGQTAPIALGFGEVRTDVDAGYFDPNAAPVAQDDDDRVSEGGATSVAVLLNDSDPDNDLISISRLSGVPVSEEGSVVLPSGATLTLNADGTVRYDGAGAVYDVLGVPTPAESLDTDDVATDTFTYTITDGNGGTASATVTISVDGENDAPEFAVDDVRLSRVEGDAPIVVEGGLTVLDPDDPVTLTARLVSAPDAPAPALPLGELDAMFSVPDTPDGAGRFTWAFDSGTEAFGVLSEGETLELTYEIIADDGDSTDSQRVILSIDGTNDAPHIAGGPDAEVLTEGDALSATGTFRLSDPDLLNPATGLPDPTLLATGARLLTVGGTASLAIDPITAAAWFGLNTTTKDGDVTWRFDTGSESLQGLGEGETVVLTYEVSADDGLSVATETVSITISGANAAPTLSGGAVTRRLQETDAALMDDGSFTVSDPDTSDLTTLTPSVSLLSTTGVTAGFSEAVLEGYLTVGAVASTGILNWQFDSGSETFDRLAQGDTLTLEYELSVSDGSLAATETVTIVIEGTNDAPSIAGGPESVTFVEDGSSVVASGTFTVTDPDSVPALSVQRTDALGQTAGIDLASLNLAVTVPGSPAPGGGVTWAFDSGAEAFTSLGTGEFVSLEYTLTADDGLDPSTETITITVAGRNARPQAVGDTNATDALIEAGVAGPGDPTATGSLLANDFDAEDGSPVLRGVVAGTAAGPVAGGIGTQVQGLYGALTVDAAGIWSYSLDNLDPDTQALMTSQTVHEVFTYSVEDSEGETGTAQLVLEIAGANDAPVARDDDQGADGLAESGPGVPGDSFATGNVLANDTDVDGGSIVVQGVVAGATAGPIPLGTSVGQSIAGVFGSLQLGATGTWSYVLDQNDPDTEGLASGVQGIETFSYTAWDGRGGTDTAVLTLLIEGADDNTPPVANDDLVRVDEDTNTPLRVTQNDTDAEGQTLTVAEVNGASVSPGDEVTTAAGGMIFVTLAGLRYLGAPEFSGSDSFTYRVSDGIALSNEAAVDVDVRPLNDPPNAAPDRNANDPVVELGTVLSAIDPTAIDNVLSNDTDAESATSTLIVTQATASGAPQPVTATGTTLIGQFGSLAIRQDGSYEYLLDNLNPRTDALREGQVAIDTFTMMIRDLDGAEASAPLEIEVTGANDRPVIGLPTFSTADGEVRIASTGQTLILNADVAISPDGSGYQVAGTVTPDRTISAQVNVALLVDVSGSLNPAERQSVKDGLTALVQSLEEQVQPGLDVNVSLIAFANFAADVPLTGPVDGLVVGDRTGDVRTTTANMGQGRQVIDYDLGSSTDFANLLNSIGRLPSTQNDNGQFLLRTNYEAAFIEAVEYFRAAPDVANAENLVYFITDGEPTLYLNNLTAAVGDTTTYINEFLNDGSGSPDLEPNSELLLLTNPAFGIGARVEAFGIGLSSQGVAILEQIDSGGSPTLIVDPTELAAALGSSPVPLVGLSGLEVVVDGEAPIPLTLVETPLGLQFQADVPADLTDGVASRVEIRATTPTGETLQGVAYLGDPASQVPGLAASDVFAILTDTAAPDSPTAAGTLSLGDVDIGDTHVASAAEVSTSATGGFIGALTATVTQATGATGDLGEVSWSYTPDPVRFNALALGEQVSEVFAITVDDGGPGGTIRQNVEIRLLGGNDLPIAGEISIDLISGTTETVDPLAIALDPEGAELFLSGFRETGPINVLQNSNGTPSQADDTFTILASPTGSGPAQFEYRLSDGEAEVFGTISVNVIQINDPPLILEDRVFVTDPSGRIEIDVIQNDLDPEDDLLTIAGVTQPALGALTIEDNRLVFTPGTDFDVLVQGQTAEVRGSYTATDGEFSGSAEVIIQVPGSGSFDPGLQQDETSKPDGTGGQLAGRLIADARTNDTFVDAQLQYSYGPGTDGLIDVVIAIDRSADAIAPGQPGLVGIGDVNGDGLFDTILDAEALAIRSLVTDIENAGFEDGAVSITLLPFGTVADTPQTIVLDPRDDISTSSDFVEILIALNTIRGGGGTDYARALEGASDVFDALEAKNGPETSAKFLYVLAGGEPDLQSGQSEKDVLSQLEAGRDLLISEGVVLSGIGVDPTRSASSFFQSALDAVDTTGGGAIAISSLTLNDALAEAARPSASLQGLDVIVFNQDGQQVSSQSLGPADFKETPFGIEADLLLSGFSELQGDVGRIVATAVFDTDGNGAPDLSLENTLTVEGALPDVLIF